MRTALCFSGELRSIDKCLPVWQEKIFSKIGTFDSFYFGWDDDPEIRKLKYLEEINIKDVLLKKRVTFSEGLYHLRKRKEVNVQGMLRQLYCLQQSSILKRRYEKINNFKYDCVIRMRPDVLPEPYAIFPNLNNLDLNKLHIFKHDAWFGHNDRLYFSNSQNMDLLQERISILNKYFNGGGIFHYEIFFAETAKKYMIPVQEHDFRFKLLRLDGSLSFCWENDPYWSKMWQHRQLD